MNFYGHWSAGGGTWVHGQQAGNITSILFNQFGFNSGNIGNLGPLPIVPAPSLAGQLNAYFWSYSW